jgi:hypothetical protein
MYDQGKLESLKRELEKWEETSLQRSLVQYPER